MLKRVDREGICKVALRVDKRRGWIEKSYQVIERVCDTYQESNHWNFGPLRYRKSFQ